MFLTLLPCPDKVIKTFEIVNSKYKHLDTLIFKPAIFLHFQVAADTGGRVLTFLEKMTREGLENEQNAIKKVLERTEMLRGRAMRLGRAGRFVCKEYINR